VQAREVSPLTGCDEQFTLIQLLVLPSRYPHRSIRPQSRRARLDRTSAPRWT